MPLRARRASALAAFLVASSAVLSGCESLPEVVPVADPQAVWKAREQALAELPGWTAVGKIAVSSEDDSWSASLRWVQQGDRFRILLSGPLGQGLVELSGGPGQVVLRDAERKTLRASNPEDLLLEAVGWRVPLSGLRYWLLGRTEPGRPLRELRLDAAGRLQHLRQSGWELSYRRYGGSARLALPTRLELRTARVWARLVVTRWTLDS